MRSRSSIHYITSIKIRQRRRPAAGYNVAVYNTAKLPPEFANQVS